MQKIKIVKKKSINLIGIDEVPSTIVKATNLCETKFAADIHTFKAKKEEEQRLVTKQSVIQKLFGVEL